MNNQFRSTPVKYAVIEVTPFEEMLLRIIEARDKCYPSGEPDPTNAHQDGDEVLCETIREAAKGNINPEQAESIIKIWESIRKWYD